MRYLSTILICAFLAVLCGCEKKRQAVVAPLPEVTAARPLVQTVTRHAYFTGRLDSLAKVEITARVEGFLQKINFSDGDMVKKGQLLFEIEQDQYSALVEQAQGQLQSVTAQNADAEVNLKRIQYAFKQNVATAQELSDATTKFQVTKAEMVTKDGMLKQAQINLGYTKVYSPIDGMAGKHQVDVGNLVGYGQPTLLVTVVQQDPLYVYFDVSEQNLIMYRKFLRDQKNLKNMEVGSVDIAVRLAGESDYVHKGKLDLSFEGNIVNSSTGTIKWRGILENKDRLMTPGMFARVQLPYLKLDDTMLVPQAAIGKDLGGEYVYVVGKDDMVERKDVHTLGESYGNMVAVYDGLTKDDVVIIDGLQRVRIGIRCKPVITEMKKVVPPSGEYIPGRMENDAKTPQSQPARKKPTASDLRKRG